MKMCMGRTQQHISAFSSLYSSKWEVPINDGTDPKVPTL